jgi:hypothetical protein
VAVKCGSTAVASSVASCRPSVRQPCRRSKLFSSDKIGGGEGGEKQLGDSEKNLDNNEYRYGANRNGILGDSSMRGECGA